MAVLAYANAIGNGFVLDDIPIILRNPFVHQLRALWRAFATPYWPASSGTGQYRPLAIASYALDWWVSGGSAHWMHAVNVLWHAAASMVVLSFASQLVRARGALIAALLFALHPVHVEAVANIVGRAECMAAVFVLMALLAHRRQSWAAVPLFALALASKENSVVFVGLALASDVLFADVRVRDLMRENRARYAAYAGVLAGYAAVLVAVFSRVSLRAPAAMLAGAGVVTRTMTELTVVPQYLRLLVAPLELSSNYDWDVIQRQAGPSVLGALGAAIIAVTAVTIWQRCRTDRVVAFALVWIPIAIAPVSNIAFASGIVLAERTLYLPSVGVVLLAGVLADRLWERHSRLVPLSALAFGAFFAVRTWTRTPVWHDTASYLHVLVADR
ncbi:MAG: hypothetical protein M3081_03835 [Gemmatimonadota bacterium]|nr:hypothetical protein [Gemmatimonadota bacterium]